MEVSELDLEDLECPAEASAGMVGMAGSLEKEMVSGKPRTGVWVRGTAGDPKEAKGPDCRHWDFILQGFGHQRVFRGQTW